jgi:hypothetical protein
VTVTAELELLGKQCPTWSGLLRVVSATITLSWPTVVTPGSTVTGALAPSVVYTSS